MVNLKKIHKKMLDPAKWKIVRRVNNSGGNGGQNEATLTPAGFPLRPMYTLYLK